MYIKSLKIESEKEIIRELTFEKGINFIVDKTKTIEGEKDFTKTGNNVGKTTVLRLIDYCLGAEKKIIYSDPDSPKDIYDLVKEFLEKNNVLVTLTLKADLDEPLSEEIVIERNFLMRNKKILRINGFDISSKNQEFEKELKDIIFKASREEKPTFREIISHNCRYKDENINSTLKTLSKYTSDATYETLYLFLLGCDFKDGDEKQRIMTLLKQEDTFKKRLEKKETKNGYEMALSLLEEEIRKLNIKKSKLNINENFENDLAKLNSIRYKLNKIGNKISNIELRREIILEAKEEMEQETSNIDAQQLKVIYNQAKLNLVNIQKTFTELLNFHNTMISEKINFITKELPELEIEIEKNKALLKSLLVEEKEVAGIISRSDSFEELEILISEISGKYVKKGEYESVIKQIGDSEKILETYNEDLKKIDNTIFSEDYQKIVKEQVTKFNKHFSEISNTLYNEKYALKYEISNEAKKPKLYKFSAFNTNLSSGKKQGEILSFDIAYIDFAVENRIPCLNFLLNDKKELMHGNQLISVDKAINEKNIQLIVSVLEDKLPVQLKNKDKYVVELSQEEKLFKIESFEEE